MMGRLAKEMRNYAAMHNKQYQSYQAFLILDTTGMPIAATKEASEVDSHGH